jgi:4-hydroxybenzoate polyprenyltransferase
MIKFQHSVFALPFALATVLVATHGQPKIMDLIFIILAMITARNAAMSFNRIADHRLDALNPRTANREIPRGKLSLRFTVGFCIINSILFILVTSYFNRLTLILSPITLLIILGYSLAKRFTNYTQVFLGLALGIAPIAADVALTERVSAFSWFLGWAVLFWVAGFDLIYSTLDHDFDKKNGMKNLVVKLGISRALFLSRFFHGLCLVLFFLAGHQANLNWIYYFGLIVILVLLIYEHSLVKANDLSRVNMAFFTLNGYVAMVYFLFISIAIYAK